MRNHGLKHAFEFSEHFEIDFMKLIAIVVIVFAEYRLKICQIAKKAADNEFMLLKIILYGNLYLQ